VTLSAKSPHGHEAWCEITRPNHPECTGWCSACEEYVDWPNPDHVPSKKLGAKPTEKLREMAGRVVAAPTVAELEGFPAGEAASLRSASAWTEEQKDLVDAAIRAVAQAHAGGGEFTSDAIWAHLDGAVPVTKGLTARLMRMSRQRIIDSTGKTEISERGGHHDHGQRLTVWYSLL
jgi:hypothetical protein